MTFTFHSGTILIATVVGTEVVIEVFTFHSGTILIVNCDKCISKLLEFTFHSGTILIHYTRCNNWCKNIYIPFWYYSYPHNKTAYTYSNLL